MAVRSTWDDILPTVKPAAFLLWLPVVAAAATAGAAPVVVLDPGHGGSNPGAAGVIHEKQLTLAIAEQLADRLRKHGITVELTRTTDRTLTLRQRIAAADPIRSRPTCS
jgi:N-acetylmuramoyl-L-alanine amidase